MRASGAVEWLRVREDSPHLVGGAEPARDRPQQGLGAVRGRRGRVDRERRQRRPDPTRDDDVQRLAAQAALAEGKRTRKAMVVIRRGSAWKLQGGDKPRRQKHTKTTKCVNM